jgi:hypothetical protein
MVDDGTNSVVWLQEPVAQRMKKLRYATKWCEGGAYLLDPKTLDYLDAERIPV